MILNNNFLCRIIDIRERTTYLRCLAMAKSLKTPRKSLRANPANWRRRTRGEPALSDLLAEPIIRLMMVRDQVTDQDLDHLISRYQAKRDAGRTLKTAEPCHDCP